MKGIKPITLLYGRKVLAFYLFTFLPFYLFNFLFLSCGSNHETFILDGTFKGFNQGELYIYGINGTPRLDTISVMKGRFHYEVTLENPVTFLSLIHI